MDASGRNPAQLTHDSSDSTFAKFMPDGAGLVYQHLGDDARQSIWKIPLQGGSPVRLTSTHTMYPAVSSRGLIAVWSSLKPEEPARVIAIYQPGAAEPLRLFGFPINRMPGMFLRWMPQSDAISYIETIDGVSNIWMQPIAGGPPKMLTNFTAGRIYSFDWSRDGRLAYSQGMTTSDVVLMRGADQQ
jgi:Tol biopolymer transport system component